MEQPQHLTLLSQIARLAHCVGITPQYGRLINALFFAGTAALFLGTELALHHGHSALTALRFRLALLALTLNTAATH